MLRASSFQHVPAGNSHHLILFNRHVRGDRIHARWHERWAEDVETTCSSDTWSQPNAVYHTPTKICRHPIWTHICTHSRMKSRTKSVSRKASNSMFSNTKIDVPTSIFEIRIIQEASSLYCRPPKSLHPPTLCFIVSHSIRHHPSVLSFHFMHNQSTKNYRP